jgi:hypothetical protein
MPVDYRRKKEWEKLGYDPEIGSAIASDPPAKDFIRVFHLTTEEFAISDIAFGRLKVSFSRPLSAVADALPSTPISGSAGCCA